MKPMKHKSPASQHGFTTIQLLITLAIGAIVTAFATVGIVTARAHIRRVNSARNFAVLVERARSDSIRRHAATA